MKKNIKFFSIILLLVLTLVGLVACDKTEEVTKFKVTFDKGETKATYIENFPQNVLIADGLNLQNPLEIKANDYEFLGWFTAKEGGDKITFPYKVTKNVTLYAQWIYLKEGLEPITTTKDLPADFYDASKWVQMANDGGNLVEDEGEAIKFFQNNIGFEHKLVFDENNNAQISFLIKADNDFTIRFGADSNDNNSTSYYGIMYSWDNLVFNVGSGSWIASVNPASAGYTKGQWNRIDVLITKTDNSIELRLYVNMEFVLMNEHDGKDDVTIEKGVLTHLNPYELGDWFGVKTWDNAILLAPTTYEE